MSKEPKFKVMYYAPNGAPVSNSPKEQTRLDKRTEIIIRVLKDMGHENASIETYNQIIRDMTKDGLSKEYLAFLDTVSKIAKKEGC
jgi:hypothetical protein